MGREVTRQVGLDESQGTYSVGENVEVWKQIREDNGLYQGIEPRRTSVGVERMGSVHSSRENIGKGCRTLEPWFHFEWDVGLTDDNSDTEEIPPFPPNC